MSAKRSPFDFRGVVRLTRLGAGFLAFTFVIGFAALNTGNNSLYMVLAYMLGTLLTSGVVSRRGLRFVEASLSTPDEIWAGRAAVVHVTLLNRSRLTAVRDLVLVMRGMDAPVLVARIDRSSAVTIPLEVRFPRRGRISLERLDLYTRYPFGLFTKKRRIAIEANAIVYPRILDDPETRAMQLDGGELQPLNRPGDGQEVFGYREYQNGESVRSVHWKRSISTGRWVVRQGTAESADEVEVAVDLWAPDQTEDSFEEMISAATTTVLEAHRSGRLVRLILPDASIDSSRGVRSLFDTLALVRSDPAAGVPAVRPGAILFSLRGGADDWLASA